MVSPFLSKFASSRWVGLDAVLIAPPISLLESPNLALHTLAAVSEQAGFTVRVLYADQLFASFIGRERFGLLSHSLTSPYEQYGERLFCAHAFSGMPPFGGRAGTGGLGYESPRSLAFDQLTWDALVDISSKVGPWLTLVGQIVEQLKVPLVGLASSHQQTAASIAIAREIKRRTPETSIAIGGSNCHGEMAQGIFEVSDGAIDIVFAGEAEDPWLQLLQETSDKTFHPPRSIYPHHPRADLNALPIPEFSDFFEQRKDDDGDGSAEIWINLESSRGCWWGQKYLCTFCGINGDAPKYRAKSPERVYREIAMVLESYPTAKIRMTDVLMPRHYLKKLLPRLGADFPQLTMFYEQRADIGLFDVVTLRDAGVRFLQVGIEHFSDSILRRINKGTTGRDNVNLLRYARSCGCAVGWNFLRGVPGDKSEEWNDLPQLLPLLKHLSPPTLLRPLEITRFSPYFDHHVAHGITKIEPLDVYGDIFPPSAPTRKLAWLFTGEYESYSLKDTELLRSVTALVEDWKQSWLVPIPDIPALDVQRYGPDKYLLRDTRGLPGMSRIQRIDRAQAAAALVGDLSSRFGEAERWARECGVICTVSGRSIGLATAPTDLLEEFETAFPAPRMTWLDRTSAQTQLRTLPISGG